MIEELIEKISKRLKALKKKEIEVDYIVVNKDYLEEYLYGEPSTSVTRERAEQYKKNGHATAFGHKLYFRKKGGLFHIAVKKNG